MKVKRGYNNVLPFKPSKSSPVAQQKESAVWQKRDDHNIGDCDFSEREGRFDSIMKNVNHLLFIKRLLKIFLSGLHFLQKNTWRNLHYIDYPSHLLTDRACCWGHPDRGPSDPLHLTHVWQKQIRGKLFEAPYASTKSRSMWCTPSIVSHVLPGRYAVENGSLWVYIGKMKE